MHPTVRLLKAGSWTPPAAEVAARVAPPVAVPGVPLGDPPVDLAGGRRVVATVPLSDIKPGYMLGAKPRQQAIGHVIGIISGAIAATPLFFLLFLPPDANGLRDPATIVSERFPMPSALQWKGVADLIARGVLTQCPDYRIIRRDGQLRIVHPTSEVERDAERERIMQRRAA